MLHRQNNELMNTVFWSLYYIVIDSWVSTLFSQIAPTCINFQSSYFLFFILKKKLKLNESYSGNNHVYCIHTGMRLHDISEYIINPIRRWLSSYNSYEIIVPTRMKRNS